MSDHRMCKTGWPGILLSMVLLAAGCSAGDNLEDAFAEPLPPPDASAPFVHDTGPWAPDAPPTPER